VNPAIVQARLSVVNHAMTATITAGTEAAGWPASNLRYPQAPLLEWHSTSTVSHIVLVDMGSAKLVEMIVLVNLNAAQVQLALSATAGGSEWISPILVTGSNRWSRRFQQSYLVSPGQTYRYLRIGLQPVAPVDGAAYFRMGGIWAGPLMAVPRDIRWEEEMLTVEPLIDLQPSHNAWRQRLTMGDPYTVIRARRVAVSANGAAAGVNAELGTWLDIDHAMWRADAFAWASNRGDPSLAWIMRRVSEAAWPIHQTVSEGALVMEELMGP
jgi:hypothetical protein